MSETPNPPNHYIDRLTEFDQQAYCAVGIFTAWFACCEDMLTFILAFLTEASDAKKFRLVVSGMDARVKCERLRKAIKAYSEMDENFKVRLTFYEQTLIKLRNNIAHSMCTPIAAENRIYFNHFSRTHLHDEKPDHIDLDKLHYICDWLAWYANDLQECAQHVPSTKKVRIDTPQSPPPTVFD
jgi:hypothetical protein